MKVFYRIYDDPIDPFEEDDVNNAIIDEDGKEVSGHLLHWGMEDGQTVGVILRGNKIDTIPPKLITKVDVDFVPKALSRVIQILHDEQVPSTVVQKIIQTFQK